MPQRELVTIYALSTSILAHRGSCDVLLCIYVWAKLHSALTLRKILGKHPNSYKHPDMPLSCRQKNSENVFFIKISKVVEFKYANSLFKYAFPPPFKQNKRKSTPFKKHLTWTDFFLQAALSKPPSWIFVPLIASYSTIISIFEEGGVVWYITADSRNTTAFASPVKSRQSWCIIVEGKSAQLASAQRRTRSLQIIFLPVQRPCSSPQSKAGIKRRCRYTTRSDSAWDHALMAEALTRPFTAVIGLKLCRNTSLFGKKKISRVKIVRHNTAFGKYLETPSLIFLLKQSSSRGAAV